MNNKKAQMLGMPFSVIMSIFLIVFFIIAAFIAIKIFWCPWCSDCTLSDSASEGLFKDDLQNAVDNVWNSAGGDMGLKVKLPDKIDRVCFFQYSGNVKGKFANFSNEIKRIGEGNVYLLPVRNACKGFKYFTLKHVNIEETVKIDNPACIENGKEIGIKSERGGLVVIYGK